MPKYMIERKIPGVGFSSEEERQSMAQKSNKVLGDLKGEVQWLESFVTDDAIFCVYVAPSEELVKQHAKLAGFPADRIVKVVTVMDPSSAESSVHASMPRDKKVGDESIRYSQ